MKKCLLLLGILVAASAAVMAGTIDVPFDQPTIQAGIDAAGSGDTVLVDSGLYVENITFAGKSIVVTSSHGANSTVVEAADPAQAVVSFNSEEPKGAEISGCTITGSTHTGVLCANSSPTIRDNIITGNSSDERNIGAGIYLMNTTGAMIQGNVIYDNSAEEYGCAMHFDGLSYHDTVSYNLIYGSAGGDIEIRLLGDADSTLFHNNTISVTHAHGICHQADGTIIVKNNIIFICSRFCGICRRRHYNCRI